MSLQQAIFWNFAFYTMSASMWVLALGFSLLAGWWDWRTRRIPNWLTVSGVVAGLALSSMVGGPYGAVRSLEGAAWAGTRLMLCVRGGRRVVRRGGSCARPAPQTT